MLPRRLLTLILGCSQVAFFVALGSFTYGFNSAIIGAVIGQPSFFSYFKFNPETSYGGSIVGASNGVYAGAGCIGCWTVYWMLDILGRKRAIQVITLVCIISAAIQAGSVRIAMFLVSYPAYSSLPDTMLHPITWWDKCWI